MNQKKGEVNVVNSMQFFFTGAVLNGTAILYICYKFSFQHNIPWNKEDEILDMVSYCTSHHSKIVYIHYTFT